MTNKPFSYNYVEILKLIRKLIRPLNCDSAALAEMCLSATSHFLGENLKGNDSNSRDYDIFRFLYNLDT